jgi:hypothetical protein
MKRGLIVSTPRQMLLRLSIFRFPSLEKRYEGEC